MRILISIILGTTISSGAYALGTVGAACLSNEEIQSQLDQMSTGYWPLTSTNIASLSIAYPSILLQNACQNGLVCYKGFCSSTIGCGRETDTYIPHAPAGKECCSGYFDTKDGNCGKCPTSCKDCGTTAWKASSTPGIETRTLGVCFCGKCTKIPQYRCTTGYYQSGTDANPTCEKCPDNSTTPSAGATSITKCFIAGGTTGEDDTGEYKFNNNCYYVNP